MKVRVFIDHLEGYPKGKVIIKDNPAKVTIKKCNSAAKKARVRARYFENQQIKYIPDNMIMIDGIIMVRAVEEVLRIVDA